MYGSEESRAHAPPQLLKAAQSSSPVTKLHTSRARSPYLFCTSPVHHGREKRTTGMDSCVYGVLDMSLSLGYWSCPFRRANHSDL